MYGNPETTPGGRALKFYASVRIEVRRGEAIKNGTEIIGNRTKCKVVKNKVAPPFKECEFDIMYGKGISRDGEVLDLAVDLDIIKKSGSWFSYNGQKLGQGRDKIKEILHNDPELMKEVEEQILQKKDELLSSVKKDKKDARLEQAVNEASKTDDKDDVMIEADEDFEEFNPTE